MTDNQWEAMVIGDYEYIMPIPFRKKFGIKYTYRPNFCQQLGVFASDNNSSTNTTLSFVQELFKKYKLINYPLNHTNFFKNQGEIMLTKRTNLIIDLRLTYEILYQKYSHGLKKSLKSADKSNLKIVSGIEISESIALHKRAWGSVVQIPDSDYSNFKKVFENANKNGFSESIGVYKDEKLMGTCIILNYKNKIYYPFSAVAPEGRKHSAVAVLIDSIIKKNAGSNKLFDFEGSDIESVQTFYNRFGPAKEYYYQVDKSIPVISEIYNGFKNLLKK